MSALRHPLFTLDSEVAQWWPAKGPVTPTRSLSPEVMLTIPDKERENCQWFFGYPVEFRDDKPLPTGRSTR